MQSSQSLDVWVLRLGWEDASIWADRRWLRCPYGTQWLSILINHLWIHSGTNHSLYSGTGHAIRSNIPRSPISILLRFATCPYVYRPLPISLGRHSSRSPDIFLEPRHPASCIRSSDTSQRHGRVSDFEMGNLSQIWLFLNVSHPIRRLFS
jgi:hypothetical protein